MLNQNFVILGAIFNLFGSGRYALDTLQGKTKPNRVTWFLWTLAPLIAFIAELYKGIGITSLMTFMVGFGPFIVLLASFVNRKSFYKISKLDVICGIISLIGLLLWGVTREGNVAIFFSIWSDLFAGIPTVIKSWKEPETESHWVFLFGSISALITLLTIKKWIFAYYGFPLYIFGICLLLFVLIKFKLGKSITRK